MDGENKKPSAAMQTERIHVQMRICYIDQAMFVLCMYMSRVPKNIIIYGLSTLAVIGFCLS